MARLMADFQRILLIKPSSLGDIVHTLPVVAALKQRWPHAHLSWVVKRQWAELVERVDGVDRVWPAEPTLSGWFAQARALRAERWDLVIDLQGLFRSAAIARLSGGPMVVGFANGREGSPWFYTHRVSVPRQDMHAVDRYLLAAEVVGAPWPGAPLFRFKMLEADQAAVRSISQRIGLPIDKPWVAMHVSARWVTKRWPLHSFAAVADRLVEEGVGPVVAIGGPDERRDVEELKTLTKKPIIDAAGAVPLGCLPMFLSKAAAMITSDSGPMHVAAAVGTPLVALFGPTSPIRTGPYGRGHTVLTRDVACRPCFSRVCRHFPTMECLHEITPQDVVKAVRYALASPVALP